MSENKRLSIVFIGAGNVATHLSRAFLIAGHNILQVYSRTKESANKLADQLNTLWVNDTRKILVDADVYVIALSDDCISGFIGTIDFGNSLVVHTAGSIGIGVFKGKVKNYGVFYPLQTFSKHRQINFKDIPICIEANNSGNEIILKNLAANISDHVIKINSDQRQYLHLAAVIVSNFTNHMYSLSSIIMELKNLPFRLLKPLIRETAMKISDYHPIEVQSGPAVRNDQNVIKKHLDLLSFSPEISQLYDVVSRDILRLHQK
jgi:predicted short-subunit dehydrogenase-like oxidoreductase (DUF2520 family)